MDQIQQSLCDIKKQKPACLTDRNILRAVLADYLPNNKLKQNLILNAFDSDVVQTLRRGPDVTLSALNCISQLESDYGITKDAAFWSVQTWCYLLGLNAVADALVVLQPKNQAPIQNTNVNVLPGKEYKIGLGVSFLLNLCEEVISKCSDILRYWGLGLQCMNLKIQPIIPLFYAIALWQWDGWVFKSQELVCSNKSLHK